MERLYSILEIMKIKDVIRFHSETTTPIPDVVYHLYSLPSFDNNQTREELLGQDIQSNKFTVPNRCILFNKLNVRFKRIWRIDSDEDHKIASTEFLPLIIDENKVDFDYCFYLLASPAITDYLCGQNANTSGSHKRIDPTNFFNIGIELPPLAQQDEIGKLLSSLDTKIKLNRQINQNLEAMAKQLYDYWFVQFDFPNEEGKPYKSSGGEMVWNENLRRDIPKGWSCSDIKSALNIFTGKKDVSKAIPGSYKFFSCAPEPISSNEYMYDGEVVLVSGNGSYTGRVGYFNGKFDLYQRTYACVLKSESDTWMPFYYYTLRYMFQPVFSGGKHGSSIPYIVLGDLANFKFAKELTIINRFVSIVAPMFNEQFKRLVETEQLIKQRNELLPLLMNGQVSVNSDLSDD